MIAGLERLLPRPGAGRRGGVSGVEAPDPPAPFIVGVNRSGTTLLRLMLDAHPQLAIPPETHFIPELVTHIKGGEASAATVTELLSGHRRWPDFGLEVAELRRRLERLPQIKPRLVLRAFYGLYAEQQGKPRWGDKTPGYVKQMGLVQRALSEARFVHLIRDGRDVAVSREDRFRHEDLSMARLARIWKRRISRARRQRRRLMHYLELRFEDLVMDTEGTLRRVCEFIELPWDDAMLRYHERAPVRLQEIARDLPAAADGAYHSAQERIAAHALVAQPPRYERIGVWREKLSAAQVAEFEGIAGGLLSDLGYPLQGERDASETRDVA